MDRAHKPEQTKAPSTFKTKDLPSLRYPPLEPHTIDVLYPGSSDEDDPRTRELKERRREKAGHDYLRGRPPYILSAKLKGPLEHWDSPWGRKSKAVASAPRIERRAEGRKEDGRTGRGRKGKTAVELDNRQNREGEASAELDNHHDSKPLWLKSNLEDVKYSKKDRTEASPTPRKGPMKWERGRKPDEIGRSRMDRMAGRDKIERVAHQSRGGKETDVVSPISNMKRALSSLSDVDSDVSIDADSDPARRAMQMILISGRTPQEQQAALKELRKSVKLQIFAETLSEDERKSLEVLKMELRAVINTLGTAVDAIQKYNDRARTVEAVLPSIGITHVNSVGKAPRLSASKEIQPAMRPVSKKVVKSIDKRTSSALEGDTPTSPHRILEKNHQRLHGKQGVATKIQPSSSSLLIRSSPGYDAMTAPQKQDHNSLAGEKSKIQNTELLTTIKSSSAKLQQPTTALLSDQLDQSNSVVGNLQHGLRAIKEVRASKRLRRQQTETDPVPYVPDRYRHSTETLMTDGLVRRKTSSFGLDDATDSLGTESLALGAEKQGSLHVSSLVENGTGIGLSIDSNGHASIRPGRSASTIDRLPKNHLSPKAGKTAPHPSKTANSEVPLTEDRPDKAQNQSWIHSAGSPIYQIKLPAVRDEPRASSQLSNQTVNSEWQRMHNRLFSSPPVDPENTAPNADHARIKPSSSRMKKAPPGLRMKRVTRTPHDNSEHSNSNPRPPEPISDVLLLAPNPSQRDTTDTAANGAFDKFTASPDHFRTVAQELSGESTGQHDNDQSVVPIDLQLGPACGTETTIPTLINTSKAKTRSEMLKGYMQGDGNKQTELLPRTKRRMSSTSSLVPDVQSKMKRRKKAVLIEFTSRNTETEDGECRPVTLDRSQQDGVVPDRHPDHFSHQSSISSYQQKNSKSDLEVPKATKTKSVTLPTLSKDSSRSTNATVRLVTNEAQAGISAGATEQLPDAQIINYLSGPFSGQMSNFLETEKQSIGIPSNEEQEANFSIGEEYTRAYQEPIDDLQLSVPERKVLKPSSRSKSPPKEPYPGIGNEQNHTRGKHEKKKSSIKFVDGDKPSIGSQAMTDHVSPSSAGGEKPRRSFFGVLTSPYNAFLGRMWRPSDDNQIAKATEVVNDRFEPQFRAPAAKMTLSDTPDVTSEEQKLESKILPGSYGAENFGADGTPELRISQLSQSGGFDLEQARLDDDPNVRDSEVSIHTAPPAKRRGHSANHTDDRNGDYIQIRLSPEVETSKGDPSNLSKSGDAYHDEGQLEDAVPSTVDAGPGSVNATELELAQTMQKQRSYTKDSPSALQRGDRSQALRSQLESAYTSGPGLAFELMDGSSQVLEDGQARSDFMPLSTQGLNTAIDDAGSFLGSWDMEHEMHRIHASSSQENARSGKRRMNISGAARKLVMERQ